MASILVGILYAGKLAPFRPSFSSSSFLSLRRGDESESSREKKKPHAPEVSTDRKAGSFGGTTLDLKTKAPTKKT